MGWEQIQKLRELSLVHKFADLFYLISLAVTNKANSETVPNREAFNKKLEVELGLTESEILFFNKVDEALLNKSKTEIFKLVVGILVRVMRDEKNNTGLFLIYNLQEVHDDMRGVTLSGDYSPKTRIGQICLNMIESLPEADSNNLRLMFSQMALVNKEIEKKEGFEKTLAIYDLFSSLQLFVQTLITSPIKTIDPNHSINAVILKVSKNNAITGQTRIAAKTRHEKERENEKPLVEKIIELWEAECAKNPNRKIKQTDATSAIYKIINMNEPLKALYKTLRDKDEIDYEKIKSVISKYVASKKQPKK